jgi:hypothetical protein
MIWPCSFALVDTRNGDVLREFDDVEQAVEAVRSLRLVDGASAGDIEVFVLGKDGRFTGDIIGVQSPPARPRHLISVSGSDDFDGDRPPSDVELRAVLAG